MLNAEMKSPLLTPKTDEEVPAADTAQDSNRTHMWTAYVGPFTTAKRVAGAAAMTKARESTHYKHIDAPATHMEALFSWSCTVA